MDPILLPTGIPTVVRDPSRSIEIVCHRGANEYAPENTYASAQICIDWGMDYVEIDVNTSKDDIFYLFHGPPVDRTTNGYGNFHELTAAEIDQLDAGSWFSSDYVDTRVPRLDDFLAWIQGKAKVFFDVKRAEHQPLIDLLYKHNMQNDCFFWARDPEWTQRLRELDHTLAVKINVSNVDDVLRAHERFQADIVEISLAAVDQKLIETCHERGIKVMVYHQEKEPLVFQEVLKWDVDMINLNHGDIFANVAREWNKARKL